MTVTADIVVAGAGHNSLICAAYLARAGHEVLVLDARPVPVPQERRETILQPEDIAAAVKFLVELHPRARVPELVLTPTVDDFC